jgi:hypothetical protein
MPSGGTSKSARVSPPTFSQWRSVSWHVKGSGGNPCVGAPSLTEEAEGLIEKMFTWMTTRDSEGYKAKKHG